MVISKPRIFTQFRTLTNIGNSQRKEESTQRFISSITRYNKHTSFCTLAIFLHVTVRDVACNYSANEASRDFVKSLFVISLVTYT